MSVTLLTSTKKITTLYKELCCAHLYTDICFLDEKYDVVNDIQTTCFRSHIVRGFYILHMTIRECISSCIIKVYLMYSYYGIYLDKENLRMKVSRTVSHHEITTAYMITRLR